MRMRASHPTSLTSLGLAALLIAGPLAAPSHGQEAVRGISLFPGTETPGVIPQTEPAPTLPEPVYEAGAFIATLTALPFRLAWCTVGDMVGFAVGTVLRLPVWTATAGERLASGEGLDSVGRAVVETTCPDSLVVTPTDLKQWQSPTISTARHAPQAR